MEEPKEYKTSQHLKIMKYKIMRFFAKESRQPEIIKTDLTLKQAMKHCNDPATHKEGKWFDGFTKQ
jgi:hypothetical protein